MQLKQLEALGGFISAKPVEREIKFTLDDGKEYTAKVHVRRLALGEYERVAVASKDEKYSRSARIISEAVFFGDGSERIPVEKSDRLHQSLANAILSAFHEVNGGKKG